MLHSLFPTSIAEENIKRIKVYPNPGKNYIIVDSDSKQEKEIYDLQAKKLISTKNQKIDISSLSRGIYILKVGKNYSKFMKE
ncbi:MAG: T9SS type A sorting domain-containing protein [Flavobacteriales bacterium]